MFEFLERMSHKHLHSFLKSCFLYLFFCLLLEGSDLGLGFVLAGISVWKEFQSVGGADGLSEEALLTQQLLDRIILPHFVLLYDLGK